jgi:hypothetical protein
MKAVIMLVGVLLLGFGIASMLGLLEFTEKKEVLKIGGLEASVERERSLPPWIGIAAIVAGTALVVGGALRKR